MAAPASAVWEVDFGKALEALLTAGAGRAHIGEVASDGAVALPGILVEQLADGRPAADQRLRARIGPSCQSETALISRSFENTICQGSSSTWAASNLLKFR